MSTVIDALHRGNPREVAEMIGGGADVHYRDGNGYTALIHAVHGRDVRRDPHLIDLLRLLIANGVDLNAISTYQESGLRVLSRIGRFDAVKLLLDAGADPAQLGWTPLIEAVALGSIANVEREIGAGADLEARDWWERTPFLIALLTGDVGKAQLLFDRGANADAVGRCAQPALFYAVDSHNPAMVRWLLDLGADVEQADQFETTALMEAADQDDVECLDVLIAAGGNVDREAPSGSVLRRARSAAVARRLLDAGANPASLHFEGRRVLVGLPPDADPALMTATPDEFRRAAHRRFGTANPERMNEPFWLAMIRSGLTAYAAGQHFGEPLTCPREPIWCAHRFGQSLTFLPDGRIVQIAGEHEDYYDPDFCIYNDVFVHAPDGTIDIYGYPADVFPPTDFHTATLVDDAIYVIGSLGYEGAGRSGVTPVFRLDLATFRMERLETSGDTPGWIYGHGAERTGARRIRVFDGSVGVVRDGREQEDVMHEAFVLDLDRLEWRRG